MAGMSGDKVEIIQLDSEKLSSVLPAKSFDYVLDIESSYFYPDKQAYLREVNYVLKDDGTFILAFYSESSKLEDIYHYI